MLRAKIDFPRYHLNSRKNRALERYNGREPIVLYCSSSKLLRGDHPTGRCMLPPTAHSLKTAEAETSPSSHLPG